MWQIVLYPPLISHSLGPVYSVYLPTFDPVPSGFCLSGIQKVLFCVTKVTKCMDFCFRVLKSKGMSVGDAAAVWFLSVLGSTASAAMPIAPHLRDLILSHTR